MDLVSLVVLKSISTSLDTNFAQLFVLLAGKSTTMNVKHMRLALCTAALLVGSVSEIHAQIVTVAQYDENIVQTNAVDSSITPYTVAQITTDVAEAFTIGQGGVIDFDNGTITDPNRLEVVFASGAKTLNIRNDTRSWSIGNLGTGIGGALSGGRVLFNGAPSPFPVPFLNRIFFEDVTDVLGDSTGEVVTTFGLSILDLTPSLNGGTNEIEFVVTYSDNSTESLLHTIAAGFNTNDAFFGVQAPTGLSISQIDITANNNLATDDWAFIVAPAAVPEPSSFALLAMMGATAALRRRKR